jgi:hypothetical protein
MAKNADPKPLPLREWGVWESWMTPLKWCSKTHCLQIETPDRMFYIKYLAGDILLLCCDEGGCQLVEFSSLFEFVEELLKYYNVSFIELDEVAKVLKNVNLHECKVHCRLCLGWID